MKALMVLFVILGVMSELMVHIRVERADEGRSVALNYVIYRQAVFLYAHEHQPQGEIFSASLRLPLGWRALRAWKARVQDGKLYVYGPASEWEIEAARQMLRNSMSVGRAENGRLAPQWGSVVSIPNFVPEGSLTSVIEVN